MSASKNGAPLLRIWLGVLLASLAAELLILSEPRMEIWIAGNALSGAALTLAWMFSARSTGWQS